ncbi:Sec34-domain-containing protein [Atractiella rhizophila]|nr:Sec34-domain-containing protein [Atractiella rhizophila]
MSKPANPAQQGNVRVLSLEEWETLLAPLTPAARQSVDSIANAISTRPVPEALAPRPQPTRTLSRPGTPVQQDRLKRQPSRREVILGSQSPRQGSSRAKSPPTGGFSLSTPVETPQQFYELFATVQAAMDLEQEAIYRKYLDEIRGYIERSEVVLGKLEDGRGLLKEMEANQKFVEDGAEALQDACEELLDEQRYLLHLSDNIEHKLGYFRELESAQRLLNQTGESLVLEPEFVQMLDKVESSIDFLKANRDFKDSEIYLLRFQQCLTRAMTLLKMYFINFLRHLWGEISALTLGKELDPVVEGTLFYGKFTTYADTIRPLVWELEKRADREPEEYKSLLGECHQAWTATRGQLIGAMVSEEVRRMGVAEKDLVKLTKTGCSYLRNVCQKEYDLFRSYFALSGTPEIYQQLEHLCDTLYDLLRPLILSSTLPTLCDLCTVLSAMVSLDVSDSEPSSPLASPSHFMHEQSLHSFRFNVLLSPLLEDAQTRLVFRAQAVLESDIVRFVPAAKDLDYPEKLEGGNGGIAAWKTADGGLATFELPEGDQKDSFYPTLIKTVWLLGSLESRVAGTIFEDFGNEAVSCCRRSFHTAAESIGKKSLLDSKLFLIRHLLILKEVVRNVDMVQIDRAVDFTSSIDVLGNLLRGKSNILDPSTLYHLASKGMPSFAEKTVDAKNELEADLRLACEEAITTATNEINKAAGEGEDAQKARDALKSIQTQLVLYLGDEIHEQLYKPIKEWVTGEYGS